MLARSAVSAEIGVEIHAVARTQFIDVLETSEVPENGHVIIGASSSEKHFGIDNPTRS